MSIEAMKQAPEALERHKPKISEGSLPVLTHDAAITALRNAIAQVENQSDRIVNLENTCYALLGKLQVANFKLAFRDLRPELEHHAARILNEEFGEKK
jgi:hypothetical protein